MRNRELADWLRHTEEARAEEGRRREEEHAGRAAIRSMTADIEANTRVLDGADGEGSAT